MGLVFLLPSILLPKGCAAAGPQVQRSGCRLQGGTEPNGGGVLLPGHVLQPTAHY